MIPCFLGLEKRSANLKKCSSSHMFIDFYVFWDFFSDKEINLCQVKSVPSVYLLFFIALNILFKTVSKK